jgi:hypothetical protein
MQREKAPGILRQNGSGVKAKTNSVGNLKLAFDQFPIPSFHQFIEDQRPADLPEFEAVVVETKLHARLTGFFAEIVRFLGSSSPFEPSGASICTSPTFHVAGGTPNRVSPWSRGQD